MPFLKAGIGLATGIALLAGAELKTVTEPVVTHEWGTLTSVAKEDGAAVEWAPLLGPPDLPCFVGRARQVYKGVARGLVRMETPVLYFYAQHPTTVSVRVDFRQGMITEWYPNPAAPPAQLSESQLREGSATSIEWHQVHLLPGKDLAYSISEGASHYYVARNTDAAPLRFDDQQEKMLFYRGLGYFTPPITARYERDGKLEVRNTGPEPIPLAIVFENQSGAIGFRIAENVVGSVTLDAPELTQDLTAIRQTLIARLTGFGLYPREALAMVDTWADSWFTEGARVFYIVPRALVDFQLPLTIVPAPTEIQRVFVGRLEVLSPRTKNTIKHALRAGDSETLTSFGRFLEPFITQIQRQEKEFTVSPAAQAYLRAIASGVGVDGDGYGQAPASNSAVCVE